jgi:hypothetical protein
MHVFSREYPATSAATIAANLRPTLPGCALAMARDPRSGMICTMEPTIATRGRFTIERDVATVQKKTHGWISRAPGNDGATVLAWKKKAAGAASGGAEVVSLLGENVDRNQWVACPRGPKTRKSA